MILEPTLEPLTRSRKVTSRYGLFFRSQETGVRFGVDVDPLDSPFVAALAVRFGGEGRYLTNLTAIAD